MDPAHWSDPFASPSSSPTCSSSDDAGRWEQDLFYRWVDSVASKSLGPSWDGLFEMLNTSDVERARKYRGNLPNLAARFPCVNGGIFDGTGQVGYAVSAEFKEAPWDASRIRWTSISPAIFGSMFQLVKKKEARRDDGEHYTSETNILKTIEPLFLDDYRRRAERLIANKSTSVPDRRRLQEEIASNIYIDPALMSNTRVSRNTDRFRPRQVVKGNDWAAVTLATYRGIAQTTPYR